MRAAMLEAYADNVEKFDIALLHNHPVPQLTSEDSKRSDLVRIRVSHAALNPIDAKIALGDYANVLPVKFPAPLGRDFSGWVDALPPATVANPLGLKTGDCVCGFLDHEHLDSGSFAEYLLAPMKCLARVPDGVTLQHAAALPLVALTTYTALIDAFQLDKGGDGKKILVIGGTSSTGMLALQLARSCNCVVTCTASRAYSKLCVDLGAATVIDYVAERWWEVLEGHGYDFIFDTVGGPESYELSRRVLHQRGVFYTIVGDTQGGKVTLGSIITALCNSMCRGCCGGVSYRMGMDLRCDGRGLAFFLSAVQAGQVRVVLDPVCDGATLRTATAESITALLAHQASGRAKGKIVIAVA